MPGRSPGQPPARSPKSPQEAEGGREHCPEPGGSLMDLGRCPTFSLPLAEGLRKLFSGATMASSRGMLVTVGQVGLLLGVGLFGERLGVPGPAPALLEVIEGGSGHRAQVGTGEVGTRQGKCMTLGRPLPAWALRVHPAAGLCR